MKSRFVINDLEQFIYTTRVVVYNSFSDRVDHPTKLDEIFQDIHPDNQEEFDRIISQDEATNIIKPLLKKQINKRTKEIRFVLDNDIYLSIIETMNDRAVSNILNNLVSRGLIESGYDSESNDFIFWIKDEYKEQIKKYFKEPETD